MTYEDMSLEELEAAGMAISRERDELQMEGLVIHDIMNQRRAQTKATELVAGMSDAERAALRQVVSVAAVGDDSAVGTPG